MEIANIPVPVAAVLYQKFIFFNHDTTYRIYCSKNHSMTLLWDIMFVTTQFHYSEGSKSLLMN